MKLNYLENGMIVQTRDQKLYVVAGFGISERFCGLGNEESNFFTAYEQNMLCKGDLEVFRRLDIMKVYAIDRNNFTYNLESGFLGMRLLWERKEVKPTKLTVSEIENLLGYQVEIVSEENV